MDQHCEASDAEVSRKIVSWGVRSGTGSVGRHSTDLQSDMGWIRLRVHGGEASASTVSGWRPASAQLWSAVALLFSTIP